MLRNYQLLLFFRHPFFWSNEKKFRLILIVGSDVLTEMKTGVALTGSGSPTMMEILSVINITDVSPNWVQAINPVVMKEMRSFRVYKNSLSELTLFIYNCCLHFDKISSTAKEVLDDPCRYFLNLFPCLFMSIYRSLKASDRTDRSCFKPFF
ncbi:2-5A-dependent ribonuclease [Elysia marginata]|uniref:2-5A-dependent ribonuclease n=1 Tax=Elysia marginata TaxID=1093978 RepID=A0AAV4HBA4_9GAST|nr:2-5A-dependent ribonuclease [Elysia marginata]